ncbi:MAG: hypothetical protein A2284_02400 [Deltaproteobacteria bacterium RIFOXYA12_FULL_61_11]|nr:MAG: hypothetical protein A2284_02400 [Deltaproteobacteria bacterium RIFOXYA12_FULL_61_11]
MDIESDFGACSLHHKRIRRNWLKGILYAMGARRPCPICGGFALPIKASWMHSYLRCWRCNLIYVAELPSQNNLHAAYQQVYQDSYQARHKEHWESWMEHKQRTLDALGIPSYQEQLGEPRRALDLGCGEGRLLHVLAQRGWHAEGLEINAKLAHEAQGLGYTVHLGPFEQASFSEQFALITMNHLIEHLRSPLEGLEKVRTWLVPQGRLVLETPILPDYTNTDHLYCFSAAAIDRALRKCGFVPLMWFQYIDAHYQHHNLACCAKRTA